MSKSKYLVIVESLGKVKKIQSFLGSDYRVMASLGHVRDLPADALGIDVEAGFAPKWEAVAGKNTVIKRLVKAMQEAEAIYLATDPDREGEAIAAHILALTKLTNKSVMRVTFSAITREAVCHAVEHPRSLDMHLVAAQHARRKLDRLVGYLVSPIACQALAGRYSAGRVQSPALRLVVERERKITTFRPETYYTLAVLLKTTDVSTPFLAQLTGVQGRDMPLKAVAFLKGLVERLQSAAYWVQAVQTETISRQPPAPFTTSTLQQAASTALGLAPERTMALAQTLYEAGLITYLRTDAVFVAPEAQQAALEFIGRVYGEKYLPPEKPAYKSRPNVQEAHEAIRPADVELTPDQVKETVGDGAALYSLIWRRFMASQMAAAQDTRTIVQVGAGQQIGHAYPITLEAHGSTPMFEGFCRVYEARLEQATQAEAPDNLPMLMQGQPLTLHQLIPQKKQTQPPRRYCEADLIHELEKRGIGRPSTYAAILGNLKGRDYVRLEKQSLRPTEAGCRLLDFLMGSFTMLFADDYTARMESQLDAVAAGQLGELAMLNGFWHDFEPRLQAAAAALPEVTPKPAAQPTGESCPHCGAALVYHQGAKGQFIGCSTFPKCRHSLGLEHTPLMMRPVEA